MQAVQTLNENFRELHASYIGSVFSEESGNQFSTFLLDYCNTLLKLPSYDAFNEHDKEDIAQETTIHLINYFRDHPDVAPQYPMAYVSKTLHNTAVSHFRTQKNRPVQFPNDADEKNRFERNIPDPRVTDPSITFYEPKITESIFTEEESELLHNLIDFEKDTRKQKILLNRFFGEPRKDFAEHSAELDVPLGTYKRLSSYALRDLKLCIENIENNDEIKQALLKKIANFDKLFTTTQNRVI